MSSKLEFIKQATRPGANDCHLETDKGGAQVQGAGIVTDHVNVNVMTKPASTSGLLGAAVQRRGALSFLRAASAARAHGLVLSWVRYAL